MARTFSLVKLWMRGNLDTFYPKNTNFGNFYSKIANFDNFKLMKVKYIFAHQGNTKVFWQNI